MRANRRGDLGQHVAMSIVRRRHPGTVLRHPARKIQDLTPKGASFFMARANIFPNARGP